MSWDRVNYCLDRIINPLEAFIDRFNGQILRVINKRTLTVGGVAASLYAVFLSVPVVYRTDSTPSIVVAVDYPYSGCHVRPLLGMFLSEAIPPRLPSFYRTEDVSTIWNVPLSCFPRGLRKNVIAERKAEAEERVEIRKIGF